MLNRRTAKLPPAPEPTVHPLISRIAFGSCQTQDEPLPILRTVLEWEPELFIYLGDNIYGDTNDMAVLEAKYAKMGAKKDFAALRANVPTIATWDDHDYGANDAGKDYPFRKESKDIFLKFWNEPNPSPRRERDGIYTSYRFEDKTIGKTLQIILLDTRTFRDLPLESAADIMEERLCSRSRPHQNNSWRRPVEVAGRAFEGTRRSSHHWQQHSVFPRV
jgi:phosphodiesterase/alkaline phosphatase D-like protein